MSMRNKLKDIHRLLAVPLPASIGSTAIGTIRTALTWLNFNVIIFIRHIGQPEAVCRLLT